MKRKRTASTWIGWLAFAVAGVLCVGWFAAHARGPIARLGTPDELTLYSLAGYEYLPGLGGPPPEGEMFHNFPVLGKLEVTDPADRAAIFEALERGAARGDKLAFCFQPCYGIRAAKNGRTLDFAVSFDCWHLELYGDGQQQTLPITRDPQQVFNKYLEAAHVPLASSATGN